MRRIIVATSAVATTVVAAAAGVATVGQTGLGELTGIAHGGGSAAIAQPGGGSTGVSHASVSVTGPSGRTQCVVKLAYTPDTRVHVDHFEFRFATSRSGVAEGTLSSVPGNEVLRTTLRGASAWFQLTPVFTDGTRAVDTVLGVDAAHC